MNEPNAAENSLRPTPLWLKPLRRIKNHPSDHVQRSYYVLLITIIVGISTMVVSCASMPVPFAGENSSGIAENNLPAHSVASEVMTNVTSADNLIAIQVLKAVKLSKQIRSDFPNGYVLLSLQNGKVFYDARQNVRQMTADWANTSIMFTNGNVVLTITNLEVSSSDFHFSQMHLSKEFPFIENSLVRTRWLDISPKSFDFYVEVLDKEKSIFVFGCRNSRK